MSPLLSVKNLSTHFSLENRKIYAVRNLSFDLKKGETFGIVGESGCGKSVMVKSLSRLLPPEVATISSGEILYKGQDLLKKSQKEIRSFLGKEMGMIFQDPMTSLNPTIKIGKQVGEGYRIHYPRAKKDEIKERVIKLLTQLDIPDAKSRYNQYAHELSGGMRQRVMIAIATVAKPQILIADEPTTALDVTIQAKILDSLKKIQQKEGMSIIFVTHDLSLVSSFCDRVAVMYAGEIVEIAPTQDLFNSPRHPYTRSLIDAVPRIDTPRETPLYMIQGTPPDLSLKPPGCHFAKRCQHARKECFVKKPSLFSVEKNRMTRCWLHRKEG